MPIYKYYTAQGCLAQGFTVFSLTVSEGLGISFTSHDTLPKHCVHNCNQPYDEMHQRHWLKIKFGFPQTGKGSPKIFEIDWQTPEIYKINSFFT